MLGWLVGLGVVGAVVLALAGPADASEEGQPASWVSWLKLLLGLGLLLVAARQFRSRPRGAEEAPLPRWMGAINRFAGPSPGRWRRVGHRQPQEPAAGHRWGRCHRQTGIAGGQQAMAYAVFAVVGTLGVGAPVVVYFGTGKRSAQLLGGLKDWMTHNNAVIVAVLCLVIGVKLLGDALGGLTQ